MYQQFNLTDNRDIVRDAKTRFYVLSDFPKMVDPYLRVLPEARDDNFIFTAENGADLYYCLNARKPSIGNEAKRISTDIGYKHKNYDIVFISNGEPLAAEHFERLKALNLPNRLVWCKDVPGRNETYKTAARLSETRYFFAVFAKIEIDPKFDFGFSVADWDYNHYVFQAKNPVNGLCYGHQAVILYNRDQVLVNPGNQLDFTMAQPYRPIDRVCGIARYNTDPWTAWRTAFREVIKLLMWGDQVSIERAGFWQTGGEAENAAWSAKGAQDAMSFHWYYDGRPDWMLKTYDWKWLRQVFDGELKIN